MGIGVSYRSSSGLKINSLRGFRGRDKMNILEAMERVDRSEELKLDLDMLTDEFRIMDLDRLYGEDLEFRCYWLSVWYDGRERVGIRVYEFPGELMAYSIQPYKGAFEVMHWVSVDAYRKARRYFLDRVMEIEEDMYAPNILDLDMEIDEFYRFRSVSDTNYVDYAYLDGERVRIIDRFVSLNNDSRVVVQYDDGERETVEVSELEFRINIE